MVDDVKRTVEKRSEKHPSEGQKGEVEDVDQRATGRQPSLNRLSFLTAIVTIIAFFKESAELAEFVLRRPAIALVTSLLLVLLFLGDLVPSFKARAHDYWKPLVNAAVAWANKLRVREPLRLLKYAVPLFALLLVVVGGLSITTRGVFYVMLASGEEKLPLLERAEDLNGHLERAGSSIEVRVLNPRPGTKYYSIAAGPYFSRDRAETDFEHLRTLLGGNVRSDAWVSRARLRSMDAMLRKVGF